MIKKNLMTDVLLSSLYCREVKYERFIYIVLLLIGFYFFLEVKTNEAVRENRK